jgi:hypothetical protein
MIGIYDYLRYDSHHHIAIYRARDIAARLLITAVELGPVGEFSFSDMARAFLAADMIQYNGRFNDILRAVFAKRKILSHDETTKYLESLTQIPEVRLPESINSAMASALFLEEKVLPWLEITNGENLIPLAAYRNAAGAAYLSYFSSRRITIQGTGLNSNGTATVDLFGGLTLMFDPGNRLRSVFYRPVTEIDIQQAQIMIQDLILQEQIIQQPMLTPGLARLPDGLLIRDALQFRSSSGEVSADQPHLIRYPASVDPVRTDALKLADYLKGVARRMQSKGK